MPQISSMSRTKQNSIGSKSTTAVSHSNQSPQELKEYQFAENMSLYLENILQETSLDINKYLSASNEVLLCRCYPVGNGTENGEFFNSGDRIFQINANITYKELQEVVDEKFNVKGCFMQFIGEEDEHILIDSNLVVRKAIQRAIHDSYYEGEKEITLRILVNPPASLSQGAAGYSQMIN